MHERPRSADHGRDERCSHHTSDAEFQAALSSAELSRQLLESAPDAIVGIGREGRTESTRSQQSRRSSSCSSTGVDPARMTFEITETTAVANIALASAFSARPRELGCRFALDDFGAGFGSFYYFKHLPFDYLKIDGEFVRNIATDATDRLLVSAVVEIARGMGKETIAECVADDESVTVLRELGVDWGQGFHLGDPAPLHSQLHAAAPPAGP